MRKMFIIRQICVGMAISRALTAGEKAALLGDARRR
jgi:hypothetical protein